MIKYRIEQIIASKPVMATTAEGKEVDTGYSEPTQVKQHGEVELADDWNDPMLAIQAVGGTGGSVKEMDSGMVVVSLSNKGGAFTLVPINKKDLINRGWRQVEGEVDG